jgi:hypothetical protein
MNSGWFLNNKLLVVELFLLSTALGLIATFAAPWYELRGMFAAWRILATSNVFGCGFESKSKPK